MDSSKLKYFVRSAINYFSDKVCPHCGFDNVTVIDRKYLVTQLCKCRNCKFQFRHPVDHHNFNNEFYQQDYHQNDGITTDLPSDQAMADMLKSNFSVSSKNADRFVNLFKTLLPNFSIKLVDYGSSWGYMSYQFKNSGISTQSYELSAPRAKFGNQKLDLDIKTSENDLQGGNDIFFSSHVIEHVPSIKSVVELSKKVLTEDGYFIAECPNGSVGFKKRDPEAFHLAWGLIHPNYLNDEFYQFLFGSNPYFITSSPYNMDSIFSWDRTSQITEKTEGDQILVIARPNKTLLA